jgi:hypothetical protein
MADLAFAPMLLALFFSDRRILAGAAICAALGSVLRVAAMREASMPSTLTKAITAAYVGLGAAALGFAAYRWTF